MIHRIGAILYHCLYKLIDVEKNVTLRIIFFIRNSSFVYICNYTSAEMIEKFNSETIEWKYFPSIIEFTIHNHFLQYSWEEPHYICIFKQASKIRDISSKLMESD